MTPRPGRPLPISWMTLGWWKSFMWAASLRHCSMSPEEVTSAGGHSWVRHHQNQNRPRDQKGLTFQDLNGDLLHRRVVHLQVGLPHRAELTCAAEPGQSETRSLERQEPVLTFAQHVAQTDPPLWDQNVLQLGLQLGADPQAVH